MLYGRDAEKAEIDRLAAPGRSGVLVVRGEMGVGRSSLLDHAAAAPGTTVLRTAGLESETELPFAALHQLQRPVLARIDSLPPPQADALRGAFGQRVSTAAEDRFLLGLATLGLLTSLTKDGPVRCLVDDAQWLDQASADALVFAARRLDGEGIAVVFAARDDEPGNEPGFVAPGLPELRLTGLDPAAAARLLPRDLAAQVRDRILDEAQGNPLALLELPALLTPEQRAGRLFPFDLHAVVRRGSRDYGIHALPPRTQTLLLTASADPSGDFELVLRAAGRLGATIHDVAPAERAGLLSGAVFRHPLVRTAAYTNATTAERLAAHHALAEVHTERGQAGWRAWHLAAAAPGPAEQVAAELEAVARDRANHADHADHEAACAAYERAAELSENDCAASPTGPWSRSWSGHSSRSATGPA